ncbi:MAG: polysaccharide biosynthesis/export family protein [Opitutus sp.]
MKFNSTAVALHAKIFLGCLVAVLLSACETTPSVGLTPAASGKSTVSTEAEVLVLHAGDDVKISFPGAPNLDTTQRVRTDGRITLSMVGEVVASGQTPSELEKKLLELYSSQLVSKEVTVTVVSSSFSVYVSGAVFKPGKVVSDHPMSALEAVMEAGGFDASKADMQAVRIVRVQDGSTRTYIVNLKVALEGGPSEPFYLKRSDIVHVPEKFSWF